MSCDLCVVVCVAGESISPLLPSVVRGKVIATATDESDITEDDWQAEYMKAFGTPPPKDQLYDDEHHHQAVQSASSAAFGDVFTGVHSLTARALGAKRSLVTEH